MSIHVADDKKVIVKVPLGTPSFVAEQFIREKKDWIIRQMAKVEKQTALADSMGPLTEEDIKQIKKKAKKVIPERINGSSRTAARILRGYDNLHHSPAVVFQADFCPQRPGN